MPAEWETHISTWLAWPINQATWPGRRLHEVEVTYAAMIRALLPGERIDLIVPDKPTATRVLRCLKIGRSAASRLVFHKTATADAWIRDYGPIFLKKRSAKRKNRVVMTKWIFNAWGGKYEDLAQDDQVVDRLDALRRFSRFDVPAVLEGGSIDVNGKGSCLTTEQCLLNPNRNPHLSKKEVETALKRMFGLRKVIWLKEGIEGDDTDGHVDDLARFVAPRTVLMAVESDSSDGNYRILKENLNILKTERDQDGKRLRVLEIPMPGMVTTRSGDRLPASYANFYIGNKAVLVPVYGKPNDKVTLKTIASVFPKRKVTGIDCRALVHGLGAIHCVTQQQPA